MVADGVTNMCTTVFVLACLQKQFMCFNFSQYHSYVFFRVGAMSVSPYVLNPLNSSRQESLHSPVGGCSTSYKIPNWKVSVFLGCKYSPDHSLLRSSASCAVTLHRRQIQSLCAYLFQEARTFCRLRERQHDSGRRSS